jgi:signal transduction histidine kinase
MDSYEKIHETMVALRQENARLRTDAEHAELLIASLASLLRIDLEADPFASLFESLKTVLPFDRALVLLRADPDRLVCVAAEPRLSRDVRWPVGKFFEKVMAGRIKATFSNAGLAEWRDIPKSVLSPDDPGLYLPLQVRDEHGVLMLLRAGPDAGFDRNDIALAEKFALAASHALAASEDRRIIRDNMARALAAEEASKAKNLFIANMSHELRTPLNAIIGFAEILSDPHLEDALADKRTEYAGDIHASGKHLLSIVDNLLLYTRIEAGRLSVDPVQFRLTDEVDYVVRLLSLEAARRRIGIESAHELESPVVVADRQSLRQILINIVGNAVKFSNTDSLVQVRVSSEGNASRVVLEVCDSGCGISADTLRQLGRPFVQDDASATRSHHGTGLGLAICYGLARAMGCAFSVDSCVGHGTTVRLVLPATVGDAAADPATVQDVIAPPRRAVGHS